MPALKQTFENCGFTDVVTYINSGNIIFTDSKHSQVELVDMIEVAIELNFELQIKVVVRDKSSVSHLISKLPAEWTNDDTRKSDVLFLWDAVDSPEVLGQLTTTPGVDSVEYVPGAIVWSVARSKAAKSGLKRLVGIALYKQITVRNTNTVRKIAELMEV